MTNKEPKYLTDFFLYKKKTSLVYNTNSNIFYRKDVFFETGVTTPAFGFSIRWLTFFMGIQFQRNAYYEK